MKPDLTVKVPCVSNEPKGDFVEFLRDGGTAEKFLDLVAAAGEATIDPAELEKAKGREEKTNAKADESTEEQTNGNAEWQPFPVDFLPWPLNAFVNEGAAALCCDESYIALPLLSALAATIGNSRRIRLKASWAEPCVLWAAIVGESGTTKSPALDLAMRPLLDRQAAALKEHEAVLPQYRADVATYEADLASWKKFDRRKGVPPPDEPAAPVPVRYVVSDTTTEALTRVLRHQPRGVLMYRDELSGWMNSFDCYKACRGADVAWWLSAHRAGPVIVDRKTGVQLLSVKRAAVSVIGGIQPGRSGPH